MGKLQDEFRSYRSEVEQEAARLIRERGLSPWNAIDKARRIVAERRSREKNRSAIELLASDWTVHNPTPTREPR